MQVEGLDCWWHAGMALHDVTTAQRQSLHARRDNVDRQWMRGARVDSWLGSATTESLRSTT